jgi:GTP cyclohydrolase II
VGVYVDPSESPELSEALERGDILNVTTAQIQEMATNGRLEVTHVSDGPVPLEEAEDAHFIFFRESNGILEHVAILIGDRTCWPDPVPVRIHSACLTGDLFGSLRCDCGEQLRGSLEFFAAKGGGVLLYLAQEGRGIGLGNKLRAYSLQQEGLDTVDADCTLGFGADERCYDAAVQMLRYLQVKRIQLLTNNPEKVRAVREAGIQVVDRQPLYGTLNRHNLKYVKAKVHKAGHWLGDMLSGAVAGNE